MQYRELLTKKSKIEAEIFVADTKDLPIVPYLELVSFIISIALDLLFKENDKGERVYDKVRFWQIGRIIKIIKAILEIIDRAIKLV